MTTSTMDAGRFRAWERDGWNRIPEQYHNSFAGLTTQAITPLLDAVAIAPGERLLDVATGPGYVAQAAAQRGAAVVGLDFSANMVAQARRLYPALEFREGDAEALPFADSTFDAVTLNFGLLHVAQPEKALAEAHRVLRPGGRIAFTVWANPEEAVGLGIILRAIHQHGNTDVPLPPGPPFFRFSQPEECRRVLLEAGFQTPVVTQVSQIYRLAAPDMLLEELSQSTVRMGGMLRAQTDEALAAIRREVRSAAEAYRQGDAIELPMPAVLATASKP